MKTYFDLIHEHITFLRSRGLDVEEIKFGKYIRCRAIDQTEGRGEVAYRCDLNEMEKEGYIGLVTRCRGPSGIRGKLATYGLKQNGEVIDPFESPPVEPLEVEPTEEHKMVAKKAYGFWKHSSLSGLSDYLIKKGVGYYGIRFRSTEQYGNVAVVPMVDENDHLWSYQLLNADGSKRMPKGARTKGLFHKLQPLIDGELIGLSESYATAGTCFELTGIAMTTSFSAGNIPEIARILRKLYPKSPIIIFADNDRHLVLKGNANEGLLKAQEAIKLVGQGCLHG